jgi:hypothetical protein
MKIKLPTTNKNFKKITPTLLKLLEEWLLFLRIQGILISSGRKSF